MAKVVRILIPIVLVLGLIAALAAIKADQIGLLIKAGEAASEAGPPPEVVGSATARRDTWQTTLSAVGTVEAERGVTIGNDSPGIVTRVHFDSGDQVKSGAVLVELETSVERAQLDSVSARLELAKINLKRTEGLESKGVTTVAELDKSKSEVKSLEAEAAGLRAQIERKVVRAPFSGKLGIRQVNLGQYLGPGSAITTLQSEKEGYVDFSLPQEYLGQLRAGLPVQLRVRQAGIELDGVIAAIDPGVDQSTRSATVRASTQDPDKRLRPGMFVNVLVVLDEARSVIIVPATAVVYAPFGDSVFVIEEDPKAKKKVARQQFVRLGEMRGDFVEIKKGLSGGETVVTAGAFKLRNGAPVQINNDVDLDPKLDPSPQNR